MAKPIDQLTQNEMSRKEFLPTLSLDLVSILSLSRIIELLSGYSLHNNLSNHASNLGYDSGSYGGTKTTQPTTNGFA